MFTTVVVQRSTVLKEIPFSLLAAVVLFLMANDAIMDGETLSEWTGRRPDPPVCFFLIFRIHLRHAPAPPHDGELKHLVTLSSLLYIVEALGLSAGGKLTVNPPDHRAIDGPERNIHRSHRRGRVTSLPELAIGDRRAQKKADIAVGNIVGSNIFNIFFVLGKRDDPPAPFEIASLSIDLLWSCSPRFCSSLPSITAAMRRIFLWWQQQNNTSSDVGRVP